MLLEELIESKLEECLEALDIVWEASFEAFNAGQQVIFSQNLLDGIVQTNEDYIETWPWVDVTEYVWNMYSCYDIDVLERAFSDTIWLPTEFMEKQIWQAQNYQDIHDFFCPY